MAHNIEADIAAIHGEILGFLQRRAPQIAEELAQDVMERLLRSKHKLADAGAVRAYGFVVARRALIDQYRRATVRQVVAFDPEIDRRAAQNGQDPESHVRAEQLATVINRVLQNMSAPMAEVFRLRTRHGVSFKEIAARQEVSINTALGRMHQATKKLAIELKNEGLLPHSKEDKT